jgi:hypothetical protein
MSLQPGHVDPGDLRVTLALSAEEAMKGTTRTLNLPDGRQITVHLPPGLRNGQVITLPRQGRPGSSGQRGTLLVTVNLVPQSGAGPRSLTADESGRPPGILAEGGSGEQLSLPGHQASLPGGTSLYTQPSFSMPGFTMGTPLAALPPLNTPSPSTPRPSAMRSRRRFWLVVTCLTLLLLLTSAAGIVFMVKNGPASNQRLSATALTATARSQATVIQGTSQAATATAGAAATATTAANQSDPYPLGGGKLVLYAPLTGPDSGVGWETSIHCIFRNGAYHVVAQSPPFFESCSNGLSYDNFTLEVDMQIVQGDQEGILFRGNRDTDQYYLFAIGVDGTYGLFLYVDSNVQHVERLAQGATSAFHRGLGVSNTLGLVANGNTLVIYINRLPIINVSDSSYPKGEIALLAIPLSQGGQPAEVAYRNLKVWSF